VRILNPQNQEMAVLRTSLVPGLLDCARINISRGNQDLRLFEVGHVFSVDRTDVPKLVGDYREEERMCLLMTGRAASRHWSRPDRIADIFDLKGEVEGFLRKMALDKCRFISYSTSNGLTDSALAVENHGGYAGYLGRISDSVRKQFDIEQEVFVAELALPSKVIRKERAYQQLPRFPKVKRDVAFTVNAGTSAEALETAMRGAAGGLLHSLELFDLYQGEPLPAGKKSMAFSLEFMSREKTLTEQEIEAAVVEIVRGAEQLPGVALRGLT